MGFWQGLVESYDANFEALQEEYPLSTTTISNNAEDIIVVVLDSVGDFLKAYKIAKKGKDSPTVLITIPVTESSLSRTSGISPHPVFDQYEYVKGTGKKFIEYIKQLKDFASSSYSNETVKAIFNYLTNGNLVDDLKREEIIAKDKTMIVFEVEVVGNPNSKAWENSTLFKAWNDFYISQKEKDEKVLDYITGIKQDIADSHPKKLSNSSGNAKLVSDNDNSNYTFRGKFFNSKEAFNIGYESSQKAHQFLRFLIRDRGILCDSQVIVSYSFGNKTKLPNPLNGTKDLCREFDSLFDVDMSDDLDINLSVETGKDYADALKKALNGYNSNKISSILKKHSKTAIMAFDAATPGRLSITFYKELDKEDYLEKIASWHDTCKWHQIYFDEDKKCHKYIGTPSVDNIIKAIYGNPRSVNDDSYKKIKKLARERLLHCIFDGEKISKDYVNGAVRRASNPVILENGYEQLLATTCSLVKKFYQQQFKEEYKLAIEENRTDRDYLYGRLLGAADMLEEYINYKESNNRVTNAVRYQNSFSQHPFKTWKIIEESLNPYIQKLRGKKNLSQNEMEKIKSLFQAGDFEDDSPLTGSYLLGYSLERIEIRNLVNKVNDNKQTENIKEDL